MGKRGSRAFSHKGFIGRNFGPKTKAVVAGAVVGSGAGYVMGRRQQGEEETKREEDISFIESITPNNIMGWLIIAIFVWVLCEKYKIIPKIKKFIK